MGEGDTLTTMINVSKEMKKKKKTARFNKIRCWEKL